ncbi:tannase/feruloyl esterase family alpha/beta hydrolase [Xylophilus rhododendri]|uniref:Tannase/feruloyl esterase family alpha/beta hydrolase n=1 Tax=Xylophilus rhododendri TaxID=2697032 RepID=A0A857JA09_9BURK|nr:tannase/feruloyl esterase family alpha/beta hydrolase [Xylophilus rhododendri]QHJ00568.1 tannase/feruloyl esterase family alpha/beta hydrolase [Xylophilus rhododendri]
MKHTVQDLAVAAWPRALLFGASALVVAALSACGGGGNSAVTADGATGGGGSGGGGGGGVTQPTPVVQLACGDLVGRSIAASLIGVPTNGATVTTATAVAATDTGNALGSYCKVRGSIQPVDTSAPAINFALNLPASWNGKAIHYGGGGFNGTLIDGSEQVRFGPADKRAPLALGYATFGDDGGHQSGSITDGSFATNDEAVANYGGLSLKKTHDVAMALIQAFYGNAPRLAYFLGTSTGGRDALNHIQRWPNDYIGVIANEPALNYTGTRLSNVAVGRALYSNAGAGWLNLTKTLLVQKTVLAACDKLDGVADGIVSNVESCRQLNTQVLANLRCAGGTDTGNSCLSDAQIATVLAIESPLNFTGYTLANGVTRAGGYNLLEGALVAGPFTTRDLGTRAVPGNPATSADANMYVTGDQWTKFFVTRQALFDTLAFDPLSPGAYTQRVMDVSALEDATNPDLRPFLNRGGRLILLHGLADEVISNNSTIDYYQRVVSTVGADVAAKGVRFYTVPGMGHGTGVFIPAWDSLAALENWVEAGLAPATGIVADSVAGTYGRTRPLCQYPAWPKYKGSGSADAAVNYSCVAEAGDPLACANLPSATTAYKGGNVFGEELTFSLNPSTLAYTLTIDASLQRSAGSQRSGNLLPLGNCTYASGENGATFTLGTGGVVQGGVAAPTGSSFLPLLAFASTFDNVANPAVFNTIANIYNAVGVQYGAGGTSTSYAASARLRNAGTFQTCQDTGTGQFVVYDAACTQTTKGYISYNSARGAFDLRATAAGGSAVTTGGTLSGSVVAGKVGANYVPLVLWRESGTSYGMRLYAPQQTLASGTADGSYATLLSSGSASTATLSGADYTSGSTASTLAYDSPVLGVVQAGGGRPGWLLYTAGVTGFIPAAGGTFETGVRD